MHDHRAVAAARAALTMLRRVGHALPSRRPRLRPRLGVVGHAHLRRVTPGGGGVWPCLRHWQGWCGLPGIVPGNFGAAMTGFCA